jgi:hypothetical protein
MMRFLILIILIVNIGCGGASKFVSTEKSIIGSWKLMGMTKKPFDIEKITEIDLIGGRMNFKPDNSFDGEITYPKYPDKTVKAFGTYAIEGEILTISNQANNSITKSTFRFEKDFLIAKPLHPEGSIMYYKRIE